MKPILFNTEMVRAILDGRKTVTRRVIKPQPLSKLAYVCMGYKHGTWGYPGKDEWKYWGDESFRLSDRLSEVEMEKRWAPPCHTDDILYIRETWAPLYPDMTSNDVCGYIYRADPLSVENYDSRFPDGKNYQWEGKWRPSIHMPREAARIFLRVTNVKVERLQEIPPYDIAFEGFRRQRDFSEFWNSKIKSAELDRYGWEANPWVWVIEFEKISKEEAQHAD